MNRALMSRSAMSTGTAMLFAMLLGLSAGVARAQSVRAPYLQQGTPTSIRVVWRTAASAPSVVCYGLEPTALTLRAMGATGVDHAVAITGLEPATRYFYALSPGGTCPVAGDPADTFETSPPTGDRAPFRMWVVGDSGTGGSSQRAVIDAMRADVGSEAPDLYIHVGDMAYDNGTTSEFDSRFFSVHADILRNTVVWPAIGNHEGYTSDSATQTGPYYEAYDLPTTGAAGGLPSGTEAYYAFDYGNVHFIVLDSFETPRGVAGAMLRWLGDDLAATDQEWIVAFWHHPPYTDGSHNSDTEGELIDMRENALPILEAAGVDLVITGHSHIYERSYLVHGAYDTPTTAAGHIVDPGDGRADGDGAYDATGDGALYVVAGHGGASLSGDAAHPVMFFSELRHGSCLIDVAGDVLTLRNVRSDGVESDHVSLVRGEGLFLVSPVGGETYLAGSTVDVVWTSTGTSSGTVRLEHSLDDGRTWAPIIDATPDDGHHAWLTPRRATTEARVRVIDSADTERRAESPGTFTLSTESDVVAIAVGGVWEFYDASTAPPADWAQTLGGWSSGPAELGYGDGDEATVLAQPSPRPASVYFRRALTVAGVASMASVTVRYDDGFALFVNGTLALERNADDGHGHDVFASAQSADNEMVTASIDPALFVDGENHIAVIVKQADAGSSDVSFDLSLSLRVRVTVDPDPPDAGVPGVDGGGSPRDGGGSARDGGGGTSEDAGPGVDDDGGCGCRAVGASRSAGGLALPVIAWLALRRRRRAGA